jgi:hypothetical protein
MASAAIQSDPYASIAQPLGQSDPYASIAQPISGEQPSTLGSIGSGLEETGADIWNAVKATVNPMTSGALGAVSNAYQHISEAVPLFQAYEGARSSGKGIVDSLSAANDKAKQIADAQDVLKQRVDEFRKNPTQATTRAVGDAAALAASIWAGGKLTGVLRAAGAADVAPEAEATGEAGTEAASAEEPGIEQPGILQQVIKGEKVAQQPAQAAVRQAAGASEETPILQGNTTVLDEPLANLKQQETAAYKQVDETAGFDLKAEKASLANDQYKLAQLGNTDADITARGNLTEAINDSQDRIAEAEAKLEEAGIDPKAADTLHQQRMAGIDFKKALVKNTNPDGSVNVDGLLTASKNLRFTKYGDRLQQFMGSDGADEFMSQLQQAQDLGAHAMKAQAIAKVIAKWAVPGSVVTGFEVLRK